MKARLSTISVRVAVGAFVAIAASTLVAAPTIAHPVGSAQTPAFVEIARKSTFTGMTAIVWENTGNHLRHGQLINAKGGDSIRMINGENAGDYPLIYVPAGANSVDTPEEVGALGVWACDNGGSFPTCVQV